MQLPVYPQGAGGGWPGCGQVISVFPVRVRREHQHVRAGPGHGPGPGRGAKVGQVEHLSLISRIQPQQE